MPARMQFAVATSVLASAAAAQGDVFALSLDELAAIEVSVASVRERPVREQPAVVTVITAEEIARMGARDLVDVLKTVPGFWIQADIVGGVLTPTFRGFAGGEGKILLVVDGIEQNDELFGAAVIGQRYAASTIRRIEILRGPGSVRYGGNAELAVIKVFTKGAEVDGLEVMVQSSTSGRDVTNQIVSFAGGTVDEDWTFSVAGHVNRGMKATQDYTSPTGVVASQDDTTDLSAGSINVGVGYRGLSWRVMYSDYRYDDVLLVGEPDPQINMRAFESMHTDLRYEWQVAPDLKITPHVLYSNSNPWTYERMGLSTEIRAERYEAGIDANWSLAEHGDLLLGVEFYRSQAKRLSSFIVGNDPSTAYGDEQVHYNDIAVYSQYDFDTDWATFSIGARYEDHDYVGGAVVPRLAVTRAWELWHGKLMYNRAFRVPQIDTIQSAINGGGPALEPETLDALELEVGYNDAHWSAVANLFWFANSDAIFFDTSLGIGGNRNGGTTENWGGEFELRHSQECWSAFASLSLYQTTRNEVTPTLAGGHSNATLGVPEHKVVFGASWTPTPATSLQMLTTVVGRRWAYQYDGVGSSVQALDAEVDLTLMLQHRVDRLTVGLGVSNLLDTDVFYAQPYDGGLAPVPGQGRSLLLSVATTF